MFKEGFISQLESEDKLFGGCSLLLENKKRIIFNPEGIMLPCNLFTDLSLGKYGEDFKNSEEFLKWIKKSKTVRKFYKAVTLAPTEECAEC